MSSSTKEIVTPKGRWGLNKVNQFIETECKPDPLVWSRPEVKSFWEFLTTQARVRGTNGEYRQYSFEGREPLIEIVKTIDLVLGVHGQAGLPDATIAICGGAQFGKSATELNLGAYCTGVRWLNWGFYLPDRDLVEGMVDTKFRPDILDQLDWFARMTQIGKSVNKSGKSVNRKGAFSVTNGKQRSHGLNRIPTSYTFDVTTLDEVDDIKPAREKFVRARMTSSSVRLLVKIGTQRVAGRGQHKAWKEGSQGVMMHACPNPTCGHSQNLEENWPRICRLALNDEPQPTDPFLTHHQRRRRSRHTTFRQFYTDSWMPAVRAMLAQSRLHQPERRNVPQRQNIRFPRQLHRRRTIRLQMVELRSIHHDGHLLAAAASPLQHQTLRSMENGWRRLSG